MASLASVSAASKASQNNYPLVLKQALQEAIQIEFMTIPPYLCALWSIKNEMDPVALSIREIVQEEMLHLAIVCNMLAAIGEVPNLRGAIPRYPSRLPGSLHPTVNLTLSGLSKASLETFMEIERPKEIIQHGAHLAFLEAPTIGEFYERIGIAFRDLQPEIKTDSQIGGPLTETIITTVQDAIAATDLIRRQGEGSKESPADTGLDDLSHYYRFEELYVGQKLEYDAVSKEFFHGARIDWPDVWPMEPVPAGGYQRADVSEEAYALTVNSDRLYSEMINFLHRAWDGGGQASFLRSIQTMFELQGPAKKLMEIPISAGRKGTLGPSFRYICS